MRAVYIAMPGKVFAGLDYSQLELRVSGALSKDPGMVKAYNEDRDLHQETADFINAYMGKSMVNRTFAKTNINAQIKKTTLRL